MAPIRPRFRPAAALPAALATTLVINGCVPAPRQAAAPPRPVAVAAPAAEPTGSWEDWPFTPGTWRYERDARGSRALFGTPGGSAAALLRCDRALRQVFLSRPGDAAAPATLRTSSRTATLSARPTGGTPPYVALSFTPADPLLDAVAFSRGRFVWSQPGLPPLILPTYAEIGRVVEDCRA